ncbi:hypothetical protein B484DRAFT_403288 [Ochromonadaceae sp. CCMP2298]|nr:hypothetical protein B484DRAFT_403288 [Ochromonadaceae sp. CCMP2298]
MSKRPASEAGSGDDQLSPGAKRERKANSKYASSDHDVRGVPSDPKPAKKKALASVTVSAPSPSGRMSQPHHLLLLHLCALLSVVLPV